MASKIQPSLENENRMAKTEAKTTPLKILQDTIIINIREEKPNQVSLFAFVPCDRSTATSPIMLNKDDAVDRYGVTDSSALLACVVGPFREGQGVHQEVTHGCGFMMSCTRCMKLSNRGLVGARAALYTSFRSSCQKMRKVWGRGTKAIGKVQLKR